MTRDTRVRLPWSVEGHGVWKSEYYWYCGGNIRSFGSVHFQYLDPHQLGPKCGPTVGSGHRGDNLFGLREWRRDSIELPVLING